jgi:hypothetical protein
MSLTRDDDQGQTLHAGECHEEDHGRFACCRRRQEQRLRGARHFAATFSIGCGGEVVEKYGLQIGRGNAYIEFDIEPDRLWLNWNARQKCEEGVIVGDIDLTNKRAVGFINR